MDLFIWTGFTIGLFGSMHCLGMCGPLVLAIPHISETKAGIAIDGLIYNLGRTITYTTMGLILGLLGLSAQFAGIQDYVSIALGVIMLLTLVIPKKYYSFVNDTKSINKFVIRIKKQLKNVLENKSRFSLIIIGILNGLLPCGLVYVALAGSLAMGDVVSSAIYMFAFGLGTLPMLAVLYFSKNMISGKFRAKINKFIPYAIAIVAIILILRGLNLGIPLISPDESKTKISNTQGCCGTNE